MRDVDFPRGGGRVEDLRTQQHPGDVPRGGLDLHRVAVGLVESDVAGRGLRLQLPGADGMGEGDVPRRGMGIEAIRFHVLQSGIPRGGRGLQRSPDGAVF